MYDKYSLCISKNSDHKYSEETERFMTYIQTEKGRNGIINNIEKTQVIPIRKVKELLLCSSYKFCIFPICQVQSPNWKS